MAMLWTLGYSDGDHTLLEIAVVSDLAFATIDEAATKLEEAHLLGPV